MKQSHTISIRIPDAENRLILDYSQKTGIPKGALMRRATLAWIVRRKQRGEISIEDAWETVVLDKSIFEPEPPLDEIS